METTLLSNLVGLGVGGVLAAVVLVWKRSDDQHYAQGLRELTERSISAQNQTTVAMQQVAGAIEKLCTLQKIEERLQALEKEMHTKARRRGGEVA